MTRKPHFILLGGFLGAGKTTTVSCLARYLTDQGLHAALITNDQGQALVDTATLQNHRWPVEEIAGGCFCCRFDALLGAVNRLSRTEPPDVFIAEAVGSCTDLAATVAYPLRQLYADRCTVAPLSVLVDPLQASRMLSRDPEGAFSTDVRYLYRKQLEEADLIIINKCDLVSVEALAELQAMLAESFPLAELFVTSSRHRLNLEAWFERLVFNQQRPRPTMQLDYGRYAQGEACLAWLNASLRVHGEETFDPDALLLGLTEDLQSGLDSADAEIAHLKLSLQAADSFVRGTGVVNLVRRNQTPECTWRLGSRIRDGHVLINLRAETSPETLEGVVNASLSRSAGGASGLVMRLERLECFRPLPPVPTHRTQVGSACPVA